ncbi:hypothetical protein PAPHI01_2609 [Pancytospora philotis]|nr:hypothetical protein PAPHI01_2609 [Pancytospora philotis]
METTDDFDSYLKRQEERLGLLQKPLKELMATKGLESESQFKTSPLNRCNDRIIEFDVVPAKEESWCARRMRLCTWKKLMFMGALLLVGAITIILIISSGNGEEGAGNTDGKGSESNVSSKSNLMDSTKTGNRATTARRSSRGKSSKGR